eukprot:c20251_g1_i1.p1 GENE.c20251_g1_i1~~c20251_g1_i1.p1  ORF type:complete len:226 (+),score=41.85 c20251_g1_i1:2-679(+)
MGGNRISMPIVYAVVARGTTVLAEYAAVQGNFVMVTRRILEKIPSHPNSAMSYEYDSHLFHYIVEDQITYLCMAEAAFGRRMPFSFLEDIKTRFRKLYGDRVQTALAYAMNEDFSRTLQKQMDYFSSGLSTEAVSRVRGEIDEVKNIMVSNIERVIDRGEKIDLLVGKAENLNHQAFQFKKQSTTLKHTMWMKKMKLNCIIALIVMVLILVILFSVCGINFKSCK